MSTMQRGTTAAALLVSRVLAVALAFSTATFGTAGVASSAGASASPRTVAASQGTGWTPPVALFQTTGAVVAGVSCASAQLCVAVGAKGAQGIALSGAKTWSTVVTTGLTGNLMSASCLPNGTCEAVGEYAHQGTYRGVTYRRSNGKWSDGPDTKNPLWSVSCASESFCAGVDNLSTGHGSVFDGKNWSKPTTLAVSPYSITCPTAKFCAAVSQSGKVLYYASGAWSQGTSIDPLGYLDSISCTSVSFCVAVGGDGDALIDEGGKWSKPDIADGNGLNSVSCATTKFCMAVDSYGGVVSYDGSRWSSPRTVSSKVGFKSVSCPTVKFCAAVGSNGSSTVVFAMTYVP